ncbi:MAG: hypothetical protein JWM11_7898, partial [Planctomycetaceae bacterium]|nr:hypothetical protein [Planctomycetaceae bacterium]
MELSPTTCRKQIACVVNQIPGDLEMVEISEETAA